jgi:hypothetical protein
LKMPAPTIEPMTMAASEKSGSFCSSWDAMFLPFFGGRFKDLAVHSRSRV